ncbi:MAG: ATP-dependent DNA ligase [Actinomycetes bacterium]
MELARVVATSAALAATRSRTRKVELLVDVLTDLGDADLPAGVSFLSGQPRQDRLEVGWATVHGLEVPPAPAATLTVADVDDALEQVVAAEGTGSVGRRRDVLTGLLGRATAEEQDWLRRLLLRELRQGANEGIVVKAVAEAVEVPETAVRRALMLSGSLAAVVAAARAGGVAALDAVGLEVGRPLRPMLASPAGDLDTAFADWGTVVVEAKLDGARVQVHRDGDDVLVVTRNGNVITDRLPEAVAAARACDAQRLVLDGEAIALDADGTPLPFQTTMSRFGREHGDETDAASLPLTIAFFDVLHADGDTLDLPLAERLAVLDRVVPEAHRVERVTTDDVEVARTFLDDVLRRRHEGVMCKDPSAPYAAGRRGTAWRKLKPTHTLDLVVLAAEWGSGRRRGWLSNLHLGCLDTETGEHVMLGKTFKGLTDAMLAWQTERLQELEVRRTRQTVFVRPELVVEVELDGVVTSPRYPAGMALRFARVKAHRPDRDPASVDTLAMLRAIHAGDLRPTV